MASEPTESEVEQKVIKQIEYYFGDSNLPRDRFLLEQIKLDEGWIPIETMLKFNRLTKICDDAKAIAEALKKSDLMQVNEDQTKIRRSPDKPLPDNTEERRQEISARTVYAKEFPLDSTLDGLQEFFEKFGGIESIFMRKNEKKEFKGSVFVTFKDLEEAKKFVEEETVKHNDKELEARKFKSVYYTEKAEARKKAQQFKEVRKELATRRQQMDEEKKLENEVTPGALLYLTGFNQVTTREDIKNLLQDYGPIAWVDFNRGDKEGWVRYDTENKAKEVLEKLLKDKDNTIKLCGHTLEAKILEGEEEMEVWKRMVQDMRRKKVGGKGKGFRKPWEKKKRTGSRPCKNKRKIIREVLEKEKLGIEDDFDDSGSDHDDDENGEPPAKQTKKEEPAVTVTLKEEAVAASDDK